MFVFVFFILTALFFSLRDIRSSLIEDRYILPAIAVLIVLKIVEKSLDMQSFMAALIVVLLFVIPIALNLDFGGGDLRYGAFCALFVGLETIGWFVLISGVLHLMLLAVLKKRSFGFAPAMSVAAAVGYGVAAL